MTLCFSVDPFTPQPPTRRAPCGRRQLGGGWEGRALASQTLCCSPPPSTSEIRLAAAHTAHFTRTATFSVVQQHVAGFSARRNPGH